MKRENQAQQPPVCFLTDSLQIIPGTWFTHTSIWGEPKCIGMR